MGPKRPSPMKGGEPIAPASSFRSSGLSEHCEASFMDRAIAMRATIAFPPTSFPTTTALLHSTTQSSSSSSFYPSSFAASAFASVAPLRAQRPPAQFLLHDCGDVDHRRRHKTQLVESFHHNTTLGSLLAQVSKKGSSPSRLLERDGDWTKEQFWAVVGLLIESGRANEALQVFDIWKNKEIYRINNANYSKLIRQLSEGCLMDEAVSVFQDMENHGLVPPLAVYNDMIHGFAWKKDFDSSSATLRKMTESGVLPTTETFNGLIRAYGNHEMYDDMSKCVKRMESEGCSPNEVTYNILIGEFARGRLLDRMEGMYRTLLSKRMNLQPCTMVVMLETYAELGILEKMEEVYRKILNSKAFLKESLIRKLATVYIENYRFSRLEELGNQVISWSGRIDLVWCILLLSSACLLSRKGVVSVTQGMEVAQVRLSITHRNILALFYKKVKDFRTLDYVLAQLGRQNVKPDIVTFGILFDACQIGFDGAHVLEMWRRNGYLEEEVEMKTDPLVLTAFGKGCFIKSCEKAYSSLGTKAKERKLWTYSNVISLVFGQRAKDSQLVHRAT